LKIAHVEQEIAASDRSAIEFVLDGDSELRRVLAAIAHAEGDIKGGTVSAMALAEGYALYRPSMAIVRKHGGGVMHGLASRPRTMNARSQSSRRLAGALGHGAPCVRAPISCCWMSPPTI